METRIRSYFIFIVIFFTRLGSEAQVSTKYFLNKTEIAPQSSFFFNQNDIDSIRQYVNKDTIVVFYTSHPEKVLTYYQLLDLYFIKKSAYILPLILESAINITHPEKLVFFNDRIGDVSVTYYQPSASLSIFISEKYERWDQSSEKGKALSIFRRKFNITR